MFEEVAVDQKVKAKVVLVREINTAATLGAVLGV